MADKRKTAAGSCAFAQEADKASGSGLASCLQCAKCSSGCPVSARMDIKPHELVRLVQLDERNEVLGSRMLWECTSCETCVTRCPQNVDIPALIDALRQMARKAGKAPANSTVAAFNDIFLELVRKRGRMYEAGLMASYKLRTGTFFQDMDKVPLMLRKGKLAILPPKVRDGGERERMFQKAKTAERKSR